MTPWYYSPHLCFQRSLVGDLYDLTLLTFRFAATPSLGAAVTFPLICTFLISKGLSHISPSFI